MILITGATGLWVQPFAMLELADYKMRRSHQRLSDGDWSQSLTNISAVVHLAARVHIMQDKSADPLVKFRAVNENIKFASNDRC